MTQSDVQEYDGHQIGHNTHPGCGGSWEDAPFRGSLGGISVPFAGTSCSNFMSEGFRSHFITYYLVGVLQ